MSLISCAELLFSFEGDWFEESSHIAAAQSNTKLFIIFVCCILLVVNTDLKDCFLSDLVGFRVF